MNQKTRRGDITMFEDGEIREVSVVPKKVQAGTPEKCRIMATATPVEPGRPAKPKEETGQEQKV